MTAGAASHDATNPDATNPTVPLAYFSFSDDRHVAAVSTRAGGVSAAPYDSLNLSFSVGDEPMAVVENRRLLCRAIDEPLDALTCAHQVHAGDVVVVDASHRGRGARHGDAPVADADALVTATPGVVLAVLLADCVPVALVDPVRHVVGVAHAGWRGTVAHVAANTVATMIEEFGCDPADLRAGIGPSIGPDTYEVGRDVVAAAGAAFPRHPEVIRTRDRRTYFDLWAANRIDLERAGLDPRHIEIAGVDSRTATDRYFSHRAAQPTGRFMAVVALRDR
jgi:polyphenol oxidase